MKVICGRESFTNEFYNLLMNWIRVNVYFILPVQLNLLSRVKAQTMDRKYEPVTGINA